MTDDIIRKATTADYIETIDNLRAEVERLRSFRGRIARILGQSPSDCDDLLIVGLDSRIILAKMLTTKIKELEADRIEARAQYLLFMNDNPGCIAWNFDELDETEQDALREQARYMLELEEPWAYVQLREAREQVKLLEAAFLKAEKANLMHHMDADYADENAHEALERIKEGGKSA